MTDSKNKIKDLLFRGEDLKKLFEEIDKETEKGNMNRVSQLKRQKHVFYNYADMVVEDSIVLKYLREHNQSPVLYESEPTTDISLRFAFPNGAKREIILVKMGSLIYRGLVKGCDCGCRGEFEITEKGVDLLKKKGV